MVPLSEGDLMVRHAMATVERHMLVSVVGVDFMKGNGPMG